MALFPESGAPFVTRVPDLAGMRTKLVKDFPNHIVFYIEREDSIEVVRVLRGGQDMDVEITKNWRPTSESFYDAALNKARDVLNWI